MSSQVNVTDVMAVVRIVEHYKGKHLKALLIGLEDAGVMTPAVRKLVLDEFNSFSRSVLRRMGYTVEP